MASQPIGKIVKGLFIWYKMAKHVFTGVFIPAKIWISKTLIAQEKMMLAEIKALSEDSGWCYASNRHFSEWLGCLPTNISNYIQKFQKAEMIEVRYDNLKTFSGRKMRVNLAWYHGLQDPVNPSIPAEPPSIPAEPPSIPAEPPSIPAVTERQFKNTSILNERGDTPAPNLSNLQSQKKESPKVAEKGSFQSCSIPCSPSDFHKNGKCAENGCFEVTAIATGSEIPGVTLVGAAPFADENGKTWHDGTQLVQAAPIHHRRNGRIEIPDEAAAEILPWANGDGAQTIKGWYDRAYRQHSPKDVEAMVLKFSGVFLSSEKAAVRDMMETNPLAFFKKRFSGFIVDQPAFDRMNAPRNIGQAANGQSGKANINRLGSDPSVYNQPQKF